MLLKKIREYARSVRDMAIRKPITQSVEDNERADAMEHDEEVEKAEEKVRRLEQQLKEAKAELARKQEEMDRFEEVLPGIKPSEPPKRREAKYFLKKWRRACLWYGSIITLTVAVLWVGVLFVNWKEWWRIWPEPYITAPIKIFMRVLEYALVYVLVRLSFCWLFFKTAYDDPSTRDVVYMNLRSSVDKWPFARAFWNNAVVSTINFYRNAFRSWRDLFPFLKPGAGYVWKRISRNVKDLFCKER